MRKIVLGLVMTAIVVLMTGCMQADYQVKINKDLSAELSYKVGLSSDILALAEGSDEENPLQNMEDEYKNAGFKVKKFKEDAFEGIIATKKVKNITELKTFGNETDASKDMPSEGTLVYKQTDGFLFDKASAAITVDLSAKQVMAQLQAASGQGSDEMTADEEKEMAAAVAMMGNSIKMNFVLTMPGKASKHNASKVSDGGKTLTWKLKFGKVNKLYVEAKSPNTGNIALVIGGVVVLLGAAFIAIRRRKAKTVVYDAVEQPSADAPVANTEAAAGEAPAGEAPAGEVQAGDAPAGEAPETDSPGVESPGTDAESK